MEKMQKDLSNPEISEFCSDGSCGCGCDEFMGSKQILSKEELQKIRSLLSKDPDSRNKAPESSPVQ
jgi:hypothetical protein